MTHKLNETGASGYLIMSTQEKLSANSLGSRTLTLWGGIRTIISLMIGAGIFSSAGRIFEGVGSPGMTIIIWVATGMLGLAGALWYNLCNL